jgi:hypothetical protein
MTRWPGATWPAAARCFDAKQLAAVRAFAGLGIRELAAKAGIAPRTLHLMDRQSTRVENAAERVFSAIVSSTPACLIGSMEYSRMKLWIAALLALLAAPAVAQQDEHGHSGHPPYAGLEQCEIKALSEQQMANLRAGRGFGLALAAELNGYPGPLHVLELADRLRLTPEQKYRVQRLFESMKGEAIAAGENLIASERELDQLFATHTMAAAG